MNGAVWVPVLLSPLYLAVWSCLVAAKRGDRMLAAEPLPERRWFNGEDDEPTPEEWAEIAADEDGFSVCCRGVLRHGRCVDCEGER